MAASSFEHKPAAPRAASWYESAMRDLSVLADSAIGGLSVFATGTSPALLTQLRPIVEGIVAAQTEGEQLYQLDQAFYDPRVLKVAFPPGPQQSAEQATARLQDFIAFLGPASLVGELPFLIAEIARSHSVVEQVYPDVREYKPAPELTPYQLIADPREPPEVSELVATVMLGHLSFLALLVDQQDLRVPSQLRPSLAQRMMAGFRALLRFRASLPGVEVAEAVVPLDARLDFPALYREWNAAREFWELKDALDEVATAADDDSHEAGGNE